jgi:tetratricopeptide (TPR) repeat protein
VTAAEAERALERAYELADAGDYAGALAQADRAITLDHGNAEAHRQRGWVLENLGLVRLAEARHAYEEALGLDPDDLWAALGLATVLSRLGMNGEADSLHRRVVNEAPARLEAHPDLTEALGWAQYRLGMYSEAAETFRRWSRDESSDVAVRLDLALVLLVQGSREEALSELRSAIEEAGEEQRGHLAVALDDLRSTLEERPELSSSGGDEARAMLASALGRAADRRAADAR